MLSHQDPVELVNAPVSMCLQKMSIFLYLLGIENSLGFLGFTVLTSYLYSSLKIPLPLCALAKP